MTVCKEETASLLIVEGKDDCNGIFQLACRYSLEHLFGIWEGESDQGALERFGGSLLARVNRPQIMGIVLDCDRTEGDCNTGADRRWAQVVSRLSGFGYAIPGKPGISGTIIPAVQDLPKIGIWLMPTNQGDGIFEDFLLALLPEPALSHTRKIVLEAKELGIANYKPVHESKAIAHTYLAWQDEPGRPFGIAVKSQTFDVHHPNASAFVGWLRQLFEPELSTAAPAPEST